MSARIKPCPCCGAKAAMQQVPMDRTPNAGGYYIECSNPACALTTNLMFASMDDPRPSLREKWNRRVSSNAQCTNPETK